MLLHRALFAGALLARTHTLLPGPVQVAAINAKTLNSPEPRVNEMLRISQNFRATTDEDEAMAFADVIMVVVATPSTGQDDRHYDTGTLSSLLTLFNKNKLQNKHLVICCTVMPGALSRHGILSLAERPSVDIVCVHVCVLCVERERERERDGESVRAVPPMLMHFSVPGYWPPGGGNGYECGTCSSQCSPGSTFSEEEGEGKSKGARERGMRYGMENSTCTRTSTRTNTHTHTGSCIQKRRLS
jgi:hypothetical protein